MKKRLTKAALFLLLAVFSHNIHAQTGLLASYYFNNGNANDDIGPYNGTVVGASLTADRFGNPNHAYHFNDAPNTYINLGTTPVLKHSIQSISLWVNIDSASHYGSGVTANPILLTKNQTGSNCYEAYSIYYEFQNNQFNPLLSIPPCQQTYTFTNPVTFGNWYHLVMTYDNDTLDFYVNGTLKSKQYKGYVSTFLASDSVVLGNTANLYNNRIFAGTIDDIGFYDHVLKQAEVDSIYNAPNPIWALGIDENSINKSICTLYPNPSNGNFIIETNSKTKQTIQLYDVSGKLILNQTINGKAIINADNLSEGIYNLKIVSDKESIINRKLIIVK